MDPTDEVFNFFESMREYVDVRNILEFGTNSCFSSMMQLEVHPLATIHTFDPQSWSVRSGVKDQKKLSKLPIADIKMPDVAKFYYGERFQFRHDYSSNVKKYTSEFTNQGIGRFDYAFVDGHHSTEAATNDIQNCIDLGIKYIIVDNMSLKTVSVAVESFGDSLIEVKRLPYSQVHPTVEGCITSESMVLYEYK